MQAFQTARVKDEELYWYKAYLLLQTDSLLNNEILDLIDCADHIKTNKKHQYALFGIIVNQLENAKEYLTFEICNRFTNVFLKFVPTNKEIYCLGLFAQARHGFVINYQ